MHDDEWAALRALLRDAGVAGSEELGRFVSNTEYFAPSAFDERAAFEVLVAALPTLTDARLVGSVAGHLRRPWARGRGFDVLARQFVRWAGVDAGAAWKLGDALGSAATIGDVDHMIALARTSEYGMSRQMIVLALARFRKFSAAAEAARDLASDDDVALHALIAYRKLAGPAAALDRANQVIRECPGTEAAEKAARQAKKLQKAIS